MSVRIRYAWGNSPFGAFLVAQADEELLVFEYPLCADDALNSLRKRFPGSVIEEDAAGLKSTVEACARFVDHPDRFPAGAGSALTNQAISNAAQ